MDKLKINKENVVQIKDGLENGLITLENIDFNSIGELSIIDYISLKDFKKFIVDYSKKHNFSNDIIINWEEEISEIIDDNKLDGIIFVNKNSDFNFPDDIKEVFCGSVYQIEDINYILNKVKEGNNNIEKVIFDLPNFVYNKDDLNSIIDKDLVLFSTESVINLDSEKLKNQKLEDNKEKDILFLGVNELKKVTDILNIMVKDIKTSNLSPFEKYIAVYNIVKSYKKYNYFLGDEDKDQKYSKHSRNINLILLNDFIVCAGYAKLLEILLNIVGINNCYWLVKTNDDWHARNYVNIVDPKYGLNGYYMCDSTWDSIQSDKIMEKGYKYLHLTTEESRNEKKFDSSLGYAKLFDDMFSEYTDEEMFDYISDFSKFSKLKRILKKLDSKFYLEIENSLNDIETARKINKHFKEKLNKPIEKIIDLKAIFEVMLMIENKKYSEEEYILKWNNYIIEKGYTDKILGNFEGDIEKYSKYIENMKLIDYFSLLNKETEVYKSWCIFKAYERIIEDNLSEEYSFSRYKVNDNISLCLNININYDQNISKIINELKNIGYEVLYSNGIKILIDEKYLNYTIHDILDFLQIIKRDFTEIQKKVSYII